MSTTATLMEFRSCMMFECKTSSLGIIDSPEKQRTADMTLQQPQLSQQEVSVEGKSPQRTAEQQRDFDMVESPASSPGTSMASSPALPTESANSNVMNIGYVMRIPDMGEPSSEDDSESIPNDLTNYHTNHEEMTSPLAQLQCALEKNGLLGQRLNVPNYPTSQSDVDIRDGERNCQSLTSMEEKGNAYDGCAEIYKCHLCSYTGQSKYHFNSHMNTHFDHKCPFCDYTSRTEGRLKRHVKDFHSETPPDSWAGTRVPRLETSSGEQSMDDSVSSTGNGKPRTYRCKQCNFVAIKKNDFWEHNKTHIRAEKLLTCPQCPFVTEYKHHLEYHIRNHFGSKPFKCNKCNYSCVNKSMLNSHMKSHSNIYQYRCSDCSYATKYCHSLKLHLRKYEHKPASVLNVDGTPNPYPIIDVYGTRRGPRPKKGKTGEDSHINQVNSQALVVSQPSINYSAMAPFVPTSVMYSPQFFSGYQNGIMLRPPASLEGPGALQQQEQPHFGLKHGGLLKCILCEFSTDRQEIFHKHMLLHAASENPDLIKIYGINSESILQLQEQHMALSNYVQNQRRFGENGMQFRKNGMYSFDPDDIAKHVDSSEHRESSVSSEQRLSHERINEFASLREGNIPVIKSETDTNGSSEHSVQPEISVPSFSPQLNGYRKQSPEREKPDGASSVIVSHKTALSDSPVSPKSPAVPRNTSSAKKPVEVPESSPLDLSSAKGNDNKSSILRTDNEESSDGTRSRGSTPGSNPTVSTTATVNDNPCMVSNSDSQSPSQPRNRRKGKAFKIDHYIQFEDQNQFKSYPVEYSPDHNDATEKEEYTPKNSIVPTNTASPNHIPHQFTGSSSQYVTSAGVSQARTSQEALRESPKFLSTQNSTFPGETVTVFQQGKAKGNPSVPISSSSQSTSPVALSAPKVVQSTHIKKHSATSSSSFSKSQSMQDKAVPKICQESPEVAECPTKWNDTFTCGFCDMAFRDSVMFAMHMGYHGFSDPFTCNMCGQHSKDKVDFFLHIARAAHL